MGDYLNKEIYHKTLVSCKKAGILNKEIMDMYILHAKEVSKAGYYFEYPEDREDAISQAVEDFLKYWRGFRENDVVRLKFKRNFIPGEEITINVAGLPKINMIANKTFQIGDTVNRSLLLINNHINEIGNQYSITGDGYSYLRPGIECTIHQVKSTITIMDNTNISPDSIDSEVIFKFKDTGLIEKINGNSIKFKKPPYCFNHLTSMIRNAMVKYLNKYHPKEERDGNKMVMSRINKNNGAYNI
jgi:hypothetical protein